MKVIEKPLSVNPLKKSQVLGAVTAFLGVSGCMPLVHGSQGCMAFTKNFLTQHFREVTPMQSTAIFDIATILGDDSNLHEGLKNVIEKQKPAVVGLVTTGMTETRGDDIKGTLYRFRELYPEYDDVVIVHTVSPDFSGDAETGYAEAVASILETAAELEPKKKFKEKARMNMLAGMYLTAADIDWMKRLFESFDIELLIIPDLSGSMGGQVTRYYSLPEEGAEPADIKNAGASDFTIAVGRSMEKAADVLLEKCSVPYKKFDTLTGIRATDELLKWIVDYTGKPVPEWVQTERKRAVDAMLDAHFSFGGKVCSIAAEPDLLYGLGNFVTNELGIELECIVTTAKDGGFSSLKAKHKICGDLDDLEQFSTESNFIISNSNALNMCHRQNIPLYRAGFPIKDMLGHFHRNFIGYKGAMQLAFDLGNICLEQEINESHKIKDV